jgi:hypothetical protein
MKRYGAPHVIVSITRPLLEDLHYERFGRAYPRRHLNDPYAINLLRREHLSL